MANISQLIESQLPEYIRSDSSYSKFIIFVQSYYRWMEENSKNKIQDYLDIDYTLDEFVPNFLKHFTPHFPDNTAADSRKLLKLAKELYKAKATPNSFVFLFRALYNTHVDIFETSDAVFRASSGKWNIPKSVRLKTSNVTWLTTNNYKLFGEDSKSIAIIEGARIVSNRIEIYISEIENLFVSGEYVRVVDNSRNDVLFNGANLRAKILGQLSSIKINKNFRGELYKIGDPVVITDGLNFEISNPIGATAEVGEVTTGSIQDVQINKTANTGYGFCLENGEWEESIASVFVNGVPDSAAYLIVSAIDDSANSSIQLTDIVTDTIFPKLNIPIGSSGSPENYLFDRMASANINTRLCDAFTFSTFSTGKLEAIEVINGGGGYDSEHQPSIQVDTYYQTDISDTKPPTIYSSDLSGSLRKLGVLGPINIISGGTDYQINDEIIFTGGTGFGANAKVTNVGSNGSITQISYYGVSCANSPYNRSSIGGYGYTNKTSIGTSGLPTLSVNSTNGINASLVIYSVLADGIDVTTIPDKIGSISKITLLNSGEDYVATPNVSLRIIKISCNIANPNISLSMTYDYSNHDIYQGVDLEHATFKAKFKSVELVQGQTEDFYELMLYNYNTPPSLDLPLKLSTSANSFLGITISESYEKYSAVIGENIPTHYIVFGNGLAKANAVFLNGLQMGEGSYLNQSGHPSSFSVLQDTKYNDFTYILTAEKSVKDYKPAVLSLLHPLGKNMIGRHKLLSYTEVPTKKSANILSLMTLAEVTGNSDSYITISNETSHTNTITLFGESSNTFFANDVVVIQSDGIVVKSKVVSNNTIDNTITLDQNIITCYQNIAYVSVNVSNSSANLSPTGVVVSVSLSSANSHLNNIYSNSIIYFTGTPISSAIAKINVNTNVVSTANIILNSNTVILSSNIHNSIHLNKFIYIEGNTYTVSNTFTSPITGITVANVTPKISSSNANLVPVFANVANVILISSGSGYANTPVAFSNVTSNNTSNLVFDVTISKSNSFVINSFIENSIYNFKQEYPRTFMNYVKPGNIIICDNISYNVTALSTGYSNGRGILYDGSTIINLPHTPGGDIIYVDSYFTSNITNQLITLVKNINTSNVKIIRQSE